jgi:hypothetical protein
MHERHSKIRLLTGYRYCEEDFKPGHAERADGDHLPDLTPEKKNAEIIIRQGDERGSLRAKATFVFESLEIALRLLNETRGKHLFELSIDPRHVFHRADLRIYDEIVAALQKGKNVDQLVRQFWAGVERPDPRIELCVAEATIVKKLEDANRKSKA